MLCLWLGQGSLSEGEGFSTIDLLVLNRVDLLVFIPDIYLSFSPNKIPYLGGQMYYAFPFIKGSLG
jgi:hypothetical protein